MCKKAFNEKEIKLKSNFYNLETFSLKIKIRVFINGHCIYRSIQLIILNYTLTRIVMTFKRYPIKSHNKVNKPVRIIKFSNFKNVSEVSSMNKTTKVFF
jgi:hypothetical protein